MKSLFLSPELATSCYDTLEEIEDWKTFERNNSLMYEYYDWERHANLREVYNFFHSQRTIKNLEEETGYEGLLFDPMGVGEGISKMVKGCKLDPHVDFNWNNRVKLNRVFSLILYLGDCKGGEFRLWDKDRKNIVWSKTPSHNTSVLFKNNDSAPHSVTEVTSGVRYAIRQFYYQSNSTPAENPHQSLYWYDGENAYNVEPKMATNSIE
tara:strand:+ start:2327 stop:2953 length:627 start_codon:yes stop_codon:yes gene_type:complete